MLNQDHAQSRSWQPGDQVGHFARFRLAKTSQRFIKQQKPAALAPMPAPPQAALDSQAAPHLAICP